VRSFPRRQQYRRLCRAVGCAAASVAAGVLAVAAGALRVVPLALMLALASISLAVEARRWIRLAGRSRVGARSEEEVRRALAPLRGEGWRLRHSLAWQGRGDIDSVAIAPTGIAFAIETKSRWYEPKHLARAREMAVWLAGRRRRWCPHGAIPVLCVVTHAGSSSSSRESLWRRETGSRRCCGSGRARTSVPRSSPRKCRRR
jgi:hypothetical protein